MPNPRPNHGPVATVLVAVVTLALAGTAVVAAATRTSDPAPDSVATLTSGVIVPIDDVSTATDVPFELSFALPPSELAPSTAFTEVFGKSEVQRGRKVKEASVPGRGRAKRGTGTAVDPVATPVPTATPTTAPTAGPVSDPAPSPTPEPTTAPTATPSPTPSPTTAPTASPSPALPTPGSDINGVSLDLDLPIGGYAEQQGLTGGLEGADYVITSTADSGPGTYRDALSQGNRYVTFASALDGSTIVLQSDVRSSASNITIDGSGIDITITRFATKLSGTNVVVAGLRFENMNGSDNEDALTFRAPTTTQVFGVFGNEFVTATDGLLDVIWNDGHDVYGTICGNRFARHDKALLIHSGSPEREGGTYHITMCQNYWVDVFQRMPLSRDALVHQYNEVFERYGKPDGAGGGAKSGEAAVASEHLVENSVAIPRAQGETTWTGATTTTPRAEFAGPSRSAGGYIKVVGSLLVSQGGTTPTFLEREPDRVARPPYDYPLAPASEVLRAAVVSNAGRCLGLGEGRHVNPCASVLWLERGGTIPLDVDGSATSVELLLDGQPVGTATFADGAWSADVSLSTGTTGLLTVRATDSSGTSVLSTPVVIAVVG